MQQSNGNKSSHHSITRQQKMAVNQTTTKLPLMVAIQQCAACELASISISHKHFPQKFRLYIEETNQGKQIKREAFAKAPFCRTYVEPFFLVLPTTPYCKGIGRGHRVSPAGLPIEQVLGESTHFLSLRRDVALLLIASTRAPDGF